MRKIALNAFIVWFDCVWHSSTAVIVSMEVLDTNRSQSITSAPLFLYFGLFSFFIVYITTAANTKILSRSMMLHLFVSLSLGVSLASAIRIHYVWFALLNLKQKSKSTKCIPFNWTAANIKSRSIFFYYIFRLILSSENLHCTFDKMWNKTDDFCDSNVECENKDRKNKWHKLQNDLIHNFFSFFVS